MNVSDLPPVYTKPTLRDVCAAASLYISRWNRLCVAAPSPHPRGSRATATGASEAGLDCASGWEARVLPFLWIYSGQGGDPFRANTFFLMTLRAYPNHRMLSDFRLLRKISID